MLSFMAFKSTLILYGALSLKPASGINPLVFLGKNQRMESFLLPYYMMSGALTMEELGAFAMTSEQMCTTELKTVINKRFGLHQIHEAMAFYMENQTAGKVILRPDIQ